MPLINTCNIVRSMGTHSEQVLPSTQLLLLYVEREQYTTIQTHTGLLLLENRKSIHRQPLE